MGILCTAQLSVRLILHFLAQFGGCDLHFSVTYTLANTVIAIDVCVDLAWSANSHPSENAGYAPVDTSNKNSLCSQPNWGV